MKNKRILSLIMAGILSISMGITAYATEAEDLQAQKEAAQASLTQAENNIGSLESKKQELENYLQELNRQYDELTACVSDLGIQAARQEEELKVLQKQLEESREQSAEQYEAMKIRIAYMYERGGTTMLEVLLSSRNFAEFLNRASNVAQISKYDRNMLNKYEELQRDIANKETAASQEAEAINTLMAQKSAAQQEVQSLAASTGDSISAYIDQISDSQAEADALRAQISNADSQLANMAQMAEEAAREAEEAAIKEASQEGQTDAPVSEEMQEESAWDDYGYDPDEDTMESSSTSMSTDIVVEEEEEEEDPSSYTTESAYSDDYSSDDYDDYSSDDSYDSDSSQGGGESGSGTYLGNFMLTAYCNCALCCGTAGNLTASGTVPTAGNTVAMAGVPFGTQLLINGNVYTVEDLGTPYGHVDIYMDSHEAALAFGMQYADVYQIG